MIKGTCHCGKVTYEYSPAPEYIVECNCSICRRLAARWAYADSSEINIVCGHDDLIKYIWGDKMIAFCTCRNCGCTTHYESVDAKYTRMAVNTRMMETNEIKDIPVRFFDGADTFKFLD